MTCTGCKVEIPRDYWSRAFVFEGLAFCRRRCLDDNAARLLAILIPVARHVASRHHSKAADLMAMALRFDRPVPLL